jgi:hypothetical protein
VHTDGGKTKNIEFFDEDKGPSEVKNETKKGEEKVVEDNKGSVASLSIENKDNVNEAALKHEDSEVVITTNQFNKIIEGIFMKIAEHLLTNKHTARRHFKDIIYSHELNNEVYEAIPLQYLLDDLEKINIKIDTIGIHCLYEKLKYSDEFESIDVGKLVEELENYGIFENSLTNNNASISNRRENVEEFFENLTSFLNEKGLQVSEFLQNSIGISEEGEMLIKVKDFEEILAENNLIKTKNLSKHLIKDVVKE